MKGGSGIYRLPEGCISHVISLTSPRDSCRSAVVSTIFHSAAESDTVLERFLPPDYQEILFRAVDLLDFSSKRHLYFRVRGSILIDCSKISFALERSRGRKCYTLSARELVITWRDTLEYWRWIPLTDSRFSEVAELLKVSWLEIRGKINSEILSPRTAYAAYLIFKTVRGSRCLSFPEQVASVKVGTHVSQHFVCLEPDALSGDASWMGRRELQIREDAMTPHARDDGWMEIELGDFFNDGGEVDMSLTEFRSQWWKNGLIIQGIEVRPKD